MILALYCQVWEWKEEYGEAIYTQLRSLGLEKRNVPFLML
jgi:hypothetical protein